MSGQCWEVVGGADKGGILVRAGQTTKSEELPERLATGAIVQELHLEAERLQFKKVSGAGPETGWVSVSLKDKALLVRAAAAKAEVPAAKLADQAAAATEEAADAALRDGDYYVTLGVVFKKPGTDPSTEKVVKLNRKVGAVVHTTSNVWKSPKGGFWVELDTSTGDTGAGEKPGYVMIDAPGFGTPGPCLQMANKEDGPPLVLRAATPSNGKPWDGGAAPEKELLVLQKSTAEDIRRIITMLFGVAFGGVSITAAPTGAPLNNATTVTEMGFQGGESIVFEVGAAKAMTLRVMSPLEEGVKLVDLPIQEDWKVEQVQALLCKITGLKKQSMIMAKGKMGQRVGEDAQLKGEQLVVDAGYKDGDEIAFIYMGDPAADLEQFLASK